MNLLDEQLDKIAENVGTRLWKGFVTFGSASAGVLAIFIIVRLIKLIIDTIIYMDTPYLRMRHSSPIPNISLSTFSSTSAKSIKTGQGDRNEEEHPESLKTWNPSNNRKTTAYIPFIARKPSFRPQSTSQYDHSGWKQKL